MDILSEYFIPYGCNEWILNQSFTLYEYFEEIVE